MESISLTELAQQQLTRAQQASAGRSAHTIYGGRERTLRQTIIALTAGTGLADHDNPGQATLHVLSGQVRLATADDAVQLSAGDHAAIPDARHTLAADADSVVVLTVATDDFSAHPAAAKDFSGEPA
ncbi:MAG: LuxR family transcriptional regulator [Beutenbergiaceae bacterium]